MEGTLEINLKGTEIKTEEPKNWLQKIGSTLFGKKEYEKEIVTQLQYLQNIYKLFSELGWNNIVSLDLNGENIYEDEEQKDNDFEEVMKSAYAQIGKEDFKAEFELENKDTDDIITVEFSSKHAVGDYPLVIAASLDRSSEETKVFLRTVKDKINEVFGIESGEIEVEEDKESSDEDEEEEDEEEEKEEETED